MHLKKIIKQCQQNNSKAQSALYELFAPKLYAVSYKYSNNQQEAEDNLHDGFLTILQKIDQFKHKGSFEGWMKRIVINTALEKYRKDKIFPLINEEIKDEVVLEIEDEDIDLEILLNSIQKLPNRYRLVFNLYVLDGYSHKEIAKMLEISEGTSKSNLSRAKAILKKELENKPQQNQNNF
ncbi:RNA polymerase sigma factor [Wenyingzhuangia aestuarii]|uniref:RNA polymerase sigma factor n=1 Tax=Wenyingzhuangia aestuarii TaxID=1647582 RepID=UPI00143CA7C2|nr:RNA polymerase sigma factor [Wenyingzhuangia aestuarii]NJB82128.1 RNA polymerase sigma-70 factor (ECF subfamily) [Wenyingzhuangia aestuarii]